MPLAPPWEAPARVVVVDDSPGFLEVAREVIEASPDFVVTALLTGPDGLEERLEREGAHLVLLDVRMPGRDGVAVARALRALPSPPMVVLLSADDCPAIAADPAGHGADAFVPKARLRPATLRALRPRAALATALG